MRNGHSQWWHSSRLQVRKVILSCSLITTLLFAEFMSAVTSEAVNRSIDCLIPSEAILQRSIASSLIDALQPIAFIFLFAVFWLAVMIGWSKSWIYLLKRCILSALVVFYISYISTTKTLVNILNCVEVHDSTMVGIDQTTDYWVLDTAVVCYEGSHAFLVGLLACPFLFAFTLGVPLSVAYLVVVKVKEDYKDGWIYDVAGFIYRSYSKKYIFWESVIMLRKALLAVVVVFSYKLGANIQAVLASFVLIVALYIQTTCRPYRKEFDSLNDIESLSILFSSLIFVCSILFADDRVSHGVRVLLSVFLCSATVLFFLYLLTLFAVLAAEYLKTLLIRKGIHHSPADGTFRILGVHFINYLFTDVKDALVRWVNHGKSRRYHRPEV